MEKQQYPFTGKIICGKCHQKFTHRVCGCHPHWICRTAKTMGSKYCNMPQIRDEIFRQKTCVVLKIDTFDEKLFNEKIDRIEVLENQILNFVFKDKIEVQVHWDYISRRESWTPEMRLKAKADGAKANKKK